MIVWKHVGIGQVDSLWRWFAWEGESGLCGWHIGSIAVGVVRVAEMGVADRCSW